MQKTLFISTKTYLVLLISFLLLSLTSCGTYRTTTTDTDGIYASDDVVAVKEVTNPDSKSSKYEKYFKNKANELQIEEDEIFTDVDTYSSNTDEEELEREADDFEYSNNAWEDTDEMVVNVYNFGGY